MHTSLSVGELKKKKEIEEDGKIVVLPISIKMLEIFLVNVYTGTETLTQTLCRISVPSLHRDSTDSLMALGCVLLYCICLPNFTMSIL